MKKDYLQLVDQVETHWHYYGKLPSNIPAASWDNPHFVKALRDRGIPLKNAVGELVVRNPGGAVDPNLSSDATPDLTDEQIAVILAITNFEDKRPRATKIQALGISVQKFNGWMRNPDFKRALHKISNDTFTDALHVANEGLMKAVDRGDVNANKYYREITGRSTTQTEMNLRLVLDRLVESMQRHIKDPRVLAKIQEDFDALIAGEPVDTTPANANASANLFDNI